MITFSTIKDLYKRAAAALLRRSKPSTAANPHNTAHPHNVMGIEKLGAPTTITSDLFLVIGQPFPLGGGNRGYHTGQMYYQAIRQRDGTYDICTVMGDRSLSTGEWGLTAHEAVQEIQILATNQAKRPTTLARFPMTTASQFGYTL